MLTLTLRVRPGTSDNALYPFSSKDWSANRVHVRFPLSTHSTVSVSQYPEQPECSAKMRMCEYAPDGKVNVLLMVPVSSRSLLVMPPTRSALVAGSTRALVLVVESTRVINDPAA